MRRDRWLGGVRLLLVTVAALLFVGLGWPPVSANPPPWANAARKTTTTASPTTTTVAPTTTTVGPTTTTQPPPNCLLTSAFASPQAAVNATPNGGCLTVDQFYGQLTATLNLSRPMTVQCLDAANGFANAGTTSNLVVNITNATDLTFDGCRVESSGATLAAAGAINLGGTQTNVTLSDLTIRQAEFGIAGSPTINSIHVLRNDIRFTYATGIGFYSNQTRNVEIGYNTVVANQRSGNAGQAGIQSGGIGNTENVDRHSLWNVHHNFVDNSPDAVGTPTGCSPNHLVDMGFDQLSSSTIDDNVVRHCLGQGEGIVVNGPDNFVRRNKVYDVGNGAYTFISYGTPPQAVTNLVMEDNLADGNPLDGGNQGLALSFGPGGLPMTGIRIRRFTAIEHSLGVQSYPFQGTPAGSDNRIEDSNQGAVGPNPWCAGLAPIGMVVVNTPNCVGA